MNHLLLAASNHLQTRSARKGNNISSQIHLDISATPIFSWVKSTTGKFLRHEPLLLYREAVLLFAAFLLIAAQLFAWPILGLADNGDFPRVSCALGISRIPLEYFNYFTSSYWYSPAFYSRPPLFQSEVLLVWLGRTLAHANRPNAHFDIRYLGAVHTVIFLAGFYLLLRFLRQFAPWVQVTSALLYLWMFTDILYVAYFHSFYSDTIALLMLPLMVVSALFAAKNEAGWIPLVVLLLTALLLVTSKPQHTLLGVFPVFLLAALPLATRSLARRVFGILGAIVLLSAMVWEVRSTTPDYDSFPLFNLIFLKIAPALPDQPGPAWNTLGLVPEDRPFVGRSAWERVVPMRDEHWRDEFLARTGYRRVARFYLHHPSYPLSIMEFDLRFAAIRLRPGYLGNFRQEDRPVPRQLTKRCNSWSDLRTRLYRLYPGHAVIWYVLFMASAVTLVLRSRTQFLKKAALIALGVGLMGLMAFVFASLLCGDQTDRHLILFHEITDVTLWLACTGAFAWAAHRRNVMGYSV